jgi:MscS family membrane protein
MEQTTTIGLRYETTDDQLCFVVAELRELLHAHPKTRHTGDDPIRVRFVGFGD